MITANVLVNYDEVEASISLTSSGILWGKLSWSTPDRGAVIDIGFNDIQQFAAALNVFQIGDVVDRRDAELAGTAVTSLSQLLNCNNGIWSFNNGLIEGEQ